MKLVGKVAPLPVMQIIELYAFELENTHMLSWSGPTTSTIEALILAL